MSRFFRAKELSMGFFVPKDRFERIWDIPVCFFEEQHIRWVFLDVDNTLTTHGHPQPDPRALQWLNTCRDSGIGFVILSNNTPQRVQPFAALLDLPFAAKAHKPLGCGVRRALKMTGAKKEESVVIGDQIFTDVLCGKFSGVRSILLRPITPETGRFFQIKRFLERKILKEEKR